MKSVRELLFARHAGAQPKLDGVRANALAALAASRPRCANASAAPWWERLLGPNPLAWAGLAAVWIVLIALNRGFSGPAGGARAESPSTPVPSKAALAETVREHRRQLAEMLDLPDPQASTPGRAPAFPKRSERRESIAMA